MSVTLAALCPPAPGRVPVLGHVPALLRKPLSFFESNRTGDTTGVKRERRGRTGRRRSLLSCS